MTPTTTHRLPGLDELLDPGSLRERVAAIADERGTVVGATPFDLRWEPDRSARLGVRLTWQTGAGIAETLASLVLGDAVEAATEGAGATPLVDPPLGPAFARLDGALYVAFPNDRTLSGLSALIDAGRAANRLGAVGAPFAARALRVEKRNAQVRTVRWKPDRRAVFELEQTLEDGSRGAHEPRRGFARVLPVAELEPCVARWRAAATIAGVAAPRVERVDAEHGWFATSAAPGSALAAEPGQATKRLICDALAALHAAPAPALAVRDDRRDLAAGERALDVLAEAAPDLAPRSRALGARLASALGRLAPVEHVFRHGDLGAHHVLLTDVEAGGREGEGRMPERDTARGQISLIDWDHAANGDPHADWASLLADVRGRGLSRGWILRLAEDALGARFDPARLAWQVAAAEARRAVQALHQGRADWLSRALDALDAGERALAGLAESAAISATPPAPPVPSGAG